MQQFQGGIYLQREEDVVVMPGMLHTYQNLVGVVCVMASGYGIVL